VNVNEDRTEAEVIFTIVEGKPTLIKNINVKGNSFFSKEEILEMITINTGDRLQYYEIIASEITLQKMLYNNGFLEAAVRSDYVLDNDEQSAEVEFEITENSRFTINEIFINGLEITNTHVVKRELEFENGEYIDLEAVAVSKRNLYRTELFRSVIINVEPASDNSNHQRDIHVNIIEDDPGDFEISGGYGTIEKVRTSLSLSYNNILGEAYEAGLEGKITSIERGAEVYLTDPWAFGFPFGISLFGTYENKDEPSYNYSSYESSINFFKNFMRFSKIGLSAGYQVSKYDDLRFSLIEKEDISQDLTPEEYNEIVRILKNLSYTFHRASLKLSFHHDLRAVSYTHLTLPTTPYV
jgi:outer membrane protein assembly factor BamA